MTDEDLTVIVRDSLADIHMTTPLTDILRRGESLATRHRRARSGALLALAALGAVLAGLALSHAPQSSKTTTSVELAAFTVYSAICRCGIGDGPPTQRPERPASRVASRRNPPPGHKLHQHPLRLHRMEGRPLLDRAHNHPGKPLRPARQQRNRVHDPPLRHPRGRTAVARPVAHGRPRRQSRSRWTDERRTPHSQSDMPELITAAWSSGVTPEHWPGRATLCPGGD